VSDTTGGASLTETSENEEERTMKKLTLSKETLRTLDDQDLSAVAGGAQTGAVVAICVGQSVVCVVDSVICKSGVCKSAVCNSVACDSVAICA
jgi:hypothetical protein